MNQSISELLNMNTEELIECNEPIDTRILATVSDLTWVVVEVQTTEKRIVQYFAQIKGFDHNSSKEYLVQPYILTGDYKD